MSIRFATLLGILTLIATANASSFDSLWYDGNAEISTYRLTESRYGELRAGTRVMVFVTEPLRLTTLVKPDNPIPDSESVKVIKLNDLRQFNTGIYQYNVMTSVFQAVGAARDIASGEAIKVAFSSQEWCGNVFERMILTPSGYQGIIHSYFETEGDRSYSFNRAGNPIPEDDLWLMIRELKGPVVASKGKINFPVIPSMWSRRKSHTPAAVVSGTLAKDPAGSFITALGTVEANRLAWTIGTKTTEAIVEAGYPHRILSWQEPDGSHGEILASRREPYWNQHDNVNLDLRTKLKLPVY